MLVHTQNLGHGYGGRWLFQGLQLQVPPKARIALVGPNGSGKSTLLRLLVGLEEPLTGRVLRAKGLRIGYLPQTPPPTEPGITLRAWFDQSMQTLRDLEARLRALEHDLARAPSPARQQALLERYGRLQARFEALGGYTYEAHRDRVLHGLGLRTGDLDLPLAHLSGGQRTRAHLARLLLEAPDLLILDEPTNHLDLQGGAFLDRYLQGFPGTMLVVSHDRYFLDQVARTVWELGPAGVETYRGNYSAYLSQRAQRWRERRERWQALLERLQRDLAYIKRHMAGQNSAQAKGRLKRLSRALQALEQGGLAALDTLESTSWARLVDRFHLQTRDLTVAEAERRLRALRFPAVEPPTPRPRLAPAARSGDWVLRARDVHIGHPDRPLFHITQLDLRRGQCAALLGPNGSGKTTFLRTLVGEIPPLRGRLRLGPGVRVGYFAQAAGHLNPQHTVLQAFLSAAPELLPAEARHHLARYLFRGDAVHKPVAALSGGERARLALAMLEQQGANFLLLDEPTNHLDIPAQEALQTVLAAYPGTILLVSHDRYLVQALATQIWWLQAGQLHVFPGPYAEFVAQVGGPSGVGGSGGKFSETDRPGSRATSAPSRRAGGLSKNERRKIERRIAALEDEITALEQRLADLEAQLSQPPADPQAVRALGEEYAQVQQSIQARLAEWEALHTRLEQAAAGSPA